MELSASPVPRGPSLQITICVEESVGPSTMIVTDLGSLGIPVAHTADGVALAIPAEAAAEGGAGTIFASPEDIPAADEWSWDVTDGDRGTMVSVSFLALGTDSLEVGLSHLDDKLVSTAELICFVPDSFIMSVPRRLIETWERHVPSEVQMEGSVTPREDGDCKFEDAPERSSRARAPLAQAKRPAGARSYRRRDGPISDTVQPRNKSPTQAQNIAEIRQLLGERFDEMKMTVLARGIPACGAGGSAAGGTRYCEARLRRRPEGPRACWG